MATKFSILQSFPTKHIYVTVLYSSAIPLLGIYPQNNQKQELRFLYLNVQSNHSIELTQASLQYRGMDKQNVI